MEKEHYFLLQLFAEGEGAEAGGGEAAQAEEAVQEPQAAAEPDRELVQRHWDGVERIYAGWMEQAEELKQFFPGFDLRREIKDARFARLLRGGADLRMAYQAVHSDELLPAAMQYAAKLVEARMASAMRGSLGRPVENGLRGGGAVMVGTGVAGMSRQDYDRVCRMVERGERVSFG